MRNQQHHSSHFTLTEIFFLLGTHFDDRPKILNYRQISTNIFLLKNVSYENNNQSSSQSSKSAISEPLVFKGIYFFERTSLFNFKSLLTFLTFLNYEGPYFPKGFLLNLRPCFGIAFAQFGMIPRTKSEFAEIVVAAECYFITNHVSCSHLVLNKQVFFKRALAAMNCVYAMCLAGI